jgi:hypothetical protein
MNGSLRLRGDLPATRRDDAGESRRARNSGPRRRRARVLRDVTGGLRALKLDLVVGERSGRRIVGWWAVSMSSSPSKAMYAPPPGRGGEGKLQEAHGHDLLRRAQEKLGEGGCYDLLIE